MPVRPRMMKHNQGYKNKTMNNKEGDESTTQVPSNRATSPGLSGNFGLV